MLSFSGTARTAIGLLTPLLLACGSTEPDSSGFTMGALVNGSAWSPGGEGTTPPSATFYLGDNTLLLNGTQSGVSPRTRGIGIEVLDVVGPGTYALADTSSPGGSALYSESNGSIADGNWTMTFYWTSATRTGTLEVNELDLAAGTISGSFHFSAATALNRTVSVTSGTFAGRLSSVAGNAR